MELVERLRGIDVSALCDADKAIPVVDPAIRAMVPDVHVAGPALTVVAQDDPLPVFSALAEAAPGEVVVVATNGGRLAVCGELFATEAKRRGVAGIVIDGYCRDVQNLRRIGLPFFARGTTPMTGTMLSRAPLRQPIRCGGVDVRPGDVVFGDDDGIVIATADRIEAALDVAEAVSRREQELLEALGRGEPLHDNTNFREHVSKLDAGKASALRLEP
jgi:4-hydroxy-4-methyl-2-oxoglutarate aldolase